MAKKSQNQKVAVSKHGNKTLVVVLVVVGVLVLLGVLGTVLSGMFVKNLFESAPGVKVETKGDGSVKVDMKAGGVSASTEQKLSSDFPKDVPLYAGQKVVSSSKVKTGTGSAWTVVAEVSDSPSAAASKTKSLYEGAGWTTDSESETDGAFWQYYKKGQMEVNLYIATTDGKTNVTYSVTETTAQ